VKTLFGGISIFCVLPLILVLRLMRSICLAYSTCLGI
jgi:hypothetical protein